MGVEIECVAPKWVAALGVDAFVAAGITPADIASGEADLADLIGDADTAGRIVDAVPECGLPLEDLVVQGLGTAIAGDPAKEACVRAELDDDGAIRGALAASIAGTDGPAVEDLVGSCLS